MGFSERQTGPARLRSRLTATRLAAGVLLLLIGVAVALPGGSAAEQASDPTAPQAGQIDAGRNHTCALLNGNVRCWGFSREGQLGYGNTRTIGDDETPAGAGAVNLGEGRTAVAISAGDYHTCAVLDDGSVRCWGFGGNGRLGYGNQSHVGDDEVPGSVGPVNLGGQKAKAVAAGGSHTCAILDDDSVRCWGYAFHGQLGYGNPPPTGVPPVEPDPLNIGDDPGEHPGLQGPVNLGANRTAKAITAGDLHTCAILDDDTVRCWGNGANGQLGYGNQRNVGDRDTPETAGPVSLGGPARAISAGVAQTCVVLSGAAGSVRCWGFGGNGRLGYGNQATVGVGELPSSVGPVSLGAPARAIAVGDGHACALLDLGRVRCWGFNIDGRLGYGHRNDIGDDEPPSSAGPVELGTGRTATAIALGARHSCARLEDEDVRCWGYGGNGRLGYCREVNVGDDELPAAAGPVDLGVANSGAPGCPAATGPGTGPPPVAQVGGETPVSPLQAETIRRSAFLSCLRTAARHTRREIRRARRMSPGRRARARRHIKRHRSLMRSACVRRHGRIAGRVTDLKAKAVARSRIVLTLKAPGSDGGKPPAARSYVVKQSRRPIRTARAFRRAQSLCKGGRCRFSNVVDVNSPIELTVNDLRRRTTYYYAVAARDNVSGRLGRRSNTAKGRTFR